MSTVSAPVVPPSLSNRSLLADPILGELAGLFRVLSNETRLAILHVIARADEASVSVIAEEVGSSPQAVSNHLQRMADQGFVGSRRDGNHIYYRLIDPCVGGVMELGLCLLGHEATA